MKFNEDYKSFLSHIDKQNTTAIYKTELSALEKSAIRLFVAYLNIKHQHTNRT